MIIFQKANLIVTVIIGACILGCLQGCVQEPIALPKTVEVPVPVPCAKKADLPVRPTLYTDEELLAMDRYKRTLAMWDERRARQDLDAQQSAILASCTSKE